MKKIAFGQLSGSQKTVFVKEENAISSVIQAVWLKMFSSFPNAYSALHANFLCVESVIFCKEVMAHKIQLCNTIISKMTVEKIMSQEDKGHGQ